MFIPSAFVETDQQEIASFIRANGFGQLISVNNRTPVADHLPFILDNDRLLGHMGKANPAWHHLDDQSVLVTFLGPHGYISPSWYRDPGVPTWNYQAVHVRGRCKVFTQPDQLAQDLQQLVDKYEKPMPEPWQADYPRAC